MPPRPKRTQRSRTLLGGRVVVSVDGLEAAVARRALNAAFEEIALMHDLMSYQHPASDLSRLNREAARGPVAVNPHTLAVLRCAQTLSAASQGAFDVSVAAQLIGLGVLRDVEGAPTPDPAGDWSDIEFDARTNTVRFARPLRIDLGGLARGYAVDRALEELSLHGPTDASVRAGAVVRLMGRPDLIPLDLGRGDGGTAAVLELESAAAASSGLLPAPNDPGVAPPVLIDGRSRQPIGGRYACVVAPQAVWADGLSKAVLALGDEAEAVLAHFEAGAHLTEVEGVWRAMGICA